MPSSPMVRERTSQHDYLHVFIDSGPTGSVPLSDCRGEGGFAIGRGAEMRNKKRQRNLPHAAPSTMSIEPIVTFEKQYDLRKQIL